VHGMHDEQWAQLRKGLLKYCVLSLIAKGPVHGFGLVGQLGNLGPAVSPGTVYPLLSRLRREGLVASSWEESKGGPPRRVYQLTNKGAEESREFALVWPAVAKSVSAILSAPEESGK